MMPGGHRQPIMPVITILSTYVHAADKCHIFVNDGDFYVIPGEPGIGLFSEIDFAGIS